MITLELVGGLGNQLFGYYAGQYLGKVKNLRVQYLLSQQSKSYFQHDSSLLDFKMPENQNPFLALSSFRLGKFRVGAARTYQMKKIVQDLEYSKIYVSPVTGYDTNLTDVKDGSLIRGYFQTYKYFDFVKKIESINLMPKKSSLWCADKISQIRSTEPIVVHMRRGDYSRFKNTMGMLAPKYFQSAINLALSHFPGKPVWLFSDEQDSSKLLLELNLQCEVNYIQTPHGITSSEILYLMSQATCLVISNSTFSWWAGKLGNPNLVISPDKWFRSIPDPEDLIPQDWQRLPSQWID